MIDSWVKFPTFLKAELALTKVQYGLAGYGCLCMVILGSFLPIRTYCYELFLGTHLLGIAFIGVIAVHTPYAMRYFIAGLFCYLLNLIAVWFVKTYVAQARFEVMEAGCTKISIRLASPMKTHHIGQHINLCIPAISPFQWHPFTITSVQQQNEAFQNTIEVCVIVRGNFTRALYRKVNPAEEMRVFVSGPFGSNSIQSNNVLETYSSIVIACGGAGITFGIRLLRELTETLAMQADETTISNDRESLLNHLKTKNVYFHWSVRRCSELEWFRDELEQINSIYELHQQYPDLHIKFHVTAEDDTGNDRTPTTMTRDPTIVGSAAISSNEDRLIETIDANQIRQESQNLFSDKNKVKECPRKDIELIQGQRIQVNNVLSVDNNIGAFGKCFKSI
jgi:ferredoxin-NADP reductase